MKCKSSVKKETDKKRNNSMSANTNKETMNNKEKKGTWKIGLIAGHAAGLPPGIKEGPYLGMIVKKWKK